MSIVKVLLLRAPGINREEETAIAFEQAGAVTQFATINQVARADFRFRDYQVLVFPGGFAYGDNLGAGRVLSNELNLKLKDEIAPFISNGGLVLGICNGFQTLVKAGILPGPTSNGQSVTLTNNDSGRFECRWVYLTANPNSKCVFTRNIETIYVPVAHGEGKLVAPPEVVEKLDVALYYTDMKGRRQAGYPFNPNGSVNDIAGITDESGRVFGLMPHPEDHIYNTHHPRWTRGEAQISGLGSAIYHNAVNWVRSL
ncbi:MAG: phosphoribosylformylglycinamidine synthase I [Dehalococcoidia bacterium]|nr:phosphoribosylformylglycinamidine synthase I [Dehalococcoidia bacterium]